MLDCAGSTFLSYRENLRWRMCNGVGVLMSVPLHFPVVPIADEHLLKTNTVCKKKTINGLLSKRVCEVHLILLWKFSRSSSFYVNMNILYSPYLLTRSVLGPPLTTPYLSARPSICDGC